MKGCFKMIKAFISQPMTGLTQNEIEETREKAIKDLYSIYGKDIIVLEQGCKPFNPNVEIPHLDVLADDLKVLSHANLMYLCNGWELSRGCMVEYTCAKLFRIPLLFAEGAYNEK